MKQRLLWSALLGVILAIGLMGWFEPRAQAGGALARKLARCVNPGGTDGCYSTFQAAINASAYGDSINVWAGTYNEHIAIMNGVSIYGAGWDKTVINGNYSASMETVYVGSGNMAAFYHLQPTSPVMATGSLAFAPPYDIDGEPRTVCVSMGADQIVCKRVYLPLIDR